LSVKGHLNEVATSVVYGGRELMVKEKKVDEHPRKCLPPLFRGEGSEIEGKRGQPGAEKIRLKVGKMFAY